MNKFIIFLILLGLLYGCEKVEINQEEFSEDNVVVTESEKVEIFDDGLDKAFEELDLIDKENYGNLREFKVKARQWEFEPSVIEVNSNDYVVLYVTSSDIVHSFVMPEFNVDNILEPGKTEVIMFTADKVGTFGFRCSGDCNGGHFEMNGVLVVKE